MLEFPVAVATLQAALPHRPPMVWIDEVSRVDRDGGTCVVRLEGDRHFKDGHGVRRSSAVEWMAQAYAYVGICRKRLESTVEKIEKAYLVGVRDLVFEGTFPTEGTLTVEVKTLKELEGLTLFTGTISTADGTRLAHGTLKVWVSTALPV